MKRVLVGLLLVLVASGAMNAPPAAADSGSVRDERGDAAASYDITRLRVENGDARFRMTVDVRDLGRRGWVTFSYWPEVRVGETPPRSLQIQVSRVGGELRKWFFTCDIEVCERARCTGVRARWDAAGDTVSTSAPQRCFPRPRRNPDAAPPRVGQFHADAARVQWPDEDEYDWVGRLNVRRG